MSAALTIRPAHSGDSAALAPLVYSSGATAFDYVFNGQGLDFLRFTLAGKNSAFGFNAHWAVADADASPIGCISLYSLEQHAAQSGATIAAIARWAGWRTPMVLWRGLKIEALIPPPPPASLHIAHLAVNANQRGKGVGTQLLDFAQQRAQELGIDKLSLDVASANPRAQQLYQRQGFQLAKSNRNHISGLSDHHLLVKDLA